VISAHKSDLYFAFIFSKFDRPLNVFTQGIFQVHNHQESVLPFGQKPHEALGLSEVFGIGNDVVEIFVAEVGIREGKTL